MCLYCINLQMQCTAYLQQTFWQLYILSTKLNGSIFPIIIFVISRLNFFALISPQQPVLTGLANVMCCNEILRVSFLSKSLNCACVQHTNIVLTHVPDQSTKTFTCTLYIFWLSLGCVLRAPNQGCKFSREFSKLEIFHGN